jgi:hypothetical protein
VLPENFKNVPAPHRFVIDRPDKVGGENGISGITDLGGSGSLNVAGETNFFRLSSSAILKNGSAYFKTGTHTFNFQGVWEAMEVTIGRGIDLTYDTQTLHLKNGSTLDTQWLAYGTTTLDGGSTLKVRGNDNVFKDGHIQLKDTQSKIIFTGGKSVDAVIQDHLSGNRSDTTTSPWAVSWSMGKEPSLTPISVSTRRTASPTCRHSTSRITTSRFLNSTASHSPLEHSDLAWH